MICQIHQSRSFRVLRGVLQGSVLGSVFFSLFINNLPASLPSYVSCSFYADNMAIWSFSLSVPTAVGVTQAWSAGLSTSVFLFIRANVRPPSSQWIPTKLISSQSPLPRLPPRFQSHSHFSWDHVRPHSFLF